MVLAVDAMSDPLASQPGGTVDVAVADGTATRTDDYSTDATRTVTVGITFTIAAVSDDVDEPNETFTLSLNEGTWSRDSEFDGVVYQGGVETTILDDDEPAVYVQLSGDASVVEADGALLEHTISLVDQNGAPVVLGAGETIELSLSYGAIVDVDGIESEDLSTQQVTITLTGNGSDSSFTVSNVVADDALAEVTEGYTVSIASVDGGTNSFGSVTVSETVNSGEGRITEETYTLQLFAVVDGEYVSANEIEETGGVGTYVVLAVDGNGDPLSSQPGGTVDVAVADGTATRTDDYSTDATRTVTVGITFTIAAVSDDVDEPNETFTLSLNEGTWSRDSEFDGVVYQGGVETTILDDDEPAVYVQLSGDASVVEADGALLEHTISLVDQNGAPVVLGAGETIELSLSYGAIVDVDGIESEDLSTQQVTITLTGNGSDSSFTVSNVVADDALAEVTEGYTVSIASVDGGTNSFGSVTVSETVNSGEGRITEETYTLQLFAVVDGEYVSANEIEETGGVGTYVVLAVDGNGDPLASQPGGTVDVAVADGTATRTDDYSTDATRTVTVGITFTIAAVSDDVDEPNETFTLSLNEGTWSRDSEFDGVVYQGGVETTILDDDEPAVYVQLSGDASVVEADGALLEHTISLVDQNGAPVVLGAGETIELSLSYGAIVDVDGIESEDLSTQQVTITLTGNGSDSSFTVSNVVADDALAEVTEGYTVSIASVDGGTNSFGSVTVSETVNSGEGRITEETYTLQLFAVVDGEYVSANEIEETGGVGTYVVLAVDSNGDPLSSQPGGTVDVAVADGTATRTDDYSTDATRTVTVGITFTIAAVSDDVDEPNETFTLSLNEGTWSRDSEFDGVVYQGGVETTILDDDEPAVYVQLSGDASVVEADGALLEHTISLVDQNGAPVVLGAGETIELSLSYGAIVDVDGIESEDLSTQQVTITLTGNGSDSSFTVSNVVADDALAEVTEGYTVSIASVDGGTNSFGSVTVSETVNSGEGRITEETYTLQLFAVVDGEYVSANEIEETGGVGTYVVLAVDSNGDPLSSQPGGTVDVAVADGTATRTDDYSTDATRTVTVGITFTIAAVSDDVDEPNETFTLSLNEGTWSRDSEFDGVVYQGGVETTILDDDEPAVYVQLSGDASVVEADGALLEHTISLVDQNGAPVVLGAGETIELSLSYGAIVDVDGIESEDLSTQQVTITLTGNGSDSSFTMSNVVADDALAEVTEGYTVSIASVDGGTNSFGSVTVSETVNSGEGRITEETYTLQLFAVVDGEYVSANEIEETGGVGTYVVLAVDSNGDPLSSQPGGTVDVAVADGTATRTDDYSTDATRTVTVGITFTIAAVSDDVDEPNETFTLSLNEGTWSRDSEFDGVVYQGGVETTILDDDEPAVYVQLSGDASVVEADGALLEHTISLVDQNGAPVVLGAGETIDVEPELWRRLTV